jgi:hypothetical protein
LHRISADARVVADSGDGTWVASLRSVLAPLTDTWSRLVDAGRRLHGSAQVVAGMTVIGCVFVVAESLAFLDERVRGA